MALLLFLPHPRLIYGPSRAYFFRAMAKIVLSPLILEQFVHFFLADQLTSLARVFIDIPFVVCFYTSGAWFDAEKISRCRAADVVVAATLLSALPFFWRLMQCLRRWRETSNFDNVLNAGKYSVSLIIIAISFIQKKNPQSNVLFVAYVLIASIGTAYSFIWDVKKDWGLANPRAKNRMLRDELMYGSPALYHAIIAVNLVLRVSWVMTIAPHSFGLDGFPKEALYTTLAGVEIFRRGVWNLLRLENEQLNNCGQYRAVVNVPLPFTPSPL
jgi:xenotropic and polytropic retrovirus receptor 1